MKKRLITLLIAAAMAVMMICPAFCYGTDGGIVKIESSFTKDWEKVAYGDSGKAKMVYGFDKGLISTDYVKGYHSRRSHCAGIDFHYTKYKAAGKVAKKTRVHKDNHVLFDVAY